MQFKLIFVTAVCVLLLLKLKWPESKIFCVNILCCCFADDGKEMEKSEKKHVQGVQSYCFCSRNMQICDVLVDGSSSLNLLCAEVSDRSEYE